MITIRTFSAFLSLTILLASTKCYAYDEIKVQVRFTEDTERGEYSDSFYYTIDEWASITQEDIDKEKSERITNFVNAPEKTPIVPEPTKNELQYNLDRLNLEVSKMENKISQKEGI